MKIKFATFFPPKIWTPNLQRLTFSSISTQYWCKRPADPAADHQEHPAAAEEAVGSAAGAVPRGAGEAAREDHRRPPQEDSGPHEGGAAGAHCKPTPKMWTWVYRKEFVLLIIIQEQTGKLETDGIVRTVQVSVQGRTKLVLQGATKATLLRRWEGIIDVRKKL